MPPFPPFPPPLQFPSFILNSFPQNSLIHTSQNPNPSCCQKTLRSPGDASLYHFPALTANATFDIHNPGQQGFRHVKAERIIPFAPIGQVDEPSRHEGQGDAREEPKPHGAPEAQRQHCEQIRDLDRDFACADSWDGGKGGKVAQGEDLRAEAPDFDEEGEELDADD